MNDGIPNERWVAPALVGGVVGLLAMAAKRSGERRATTAQVLNSGVQAGLGLGIFVAFITA